MNSAVTNQTVTFCGHMFQGYNYTTLSGQYCGWAWDTLLCWPPTDANASAAQKCPNEKGLDPNKYVHKSCLADGSWEGGDFKGKPQGWTNYTTCYTPELLFLTKLLGNGSETKYEIAKRTRTLELVGLSLSLISLLTSLIIFSVYRNLQNQRTRIHCHLFIAMVIQVMARLIVYVDQDIARQARLTANITLWISIDNTPILCEASYVVLEYCRTVVFMWMFIEGLYMHNLVAVSVFDHNRNYNLLYLLLGWGAPVFVTGIWAYVTSFYYTASKCFWGYNLKSTFWILEGPRLGVVALNFLFLLNIIRVLVGKLRRSHTSEIDQVRKAVRAAVLLVPLLGISNLLSMFEAPLNKADWVFELWSYGTHALTSFQGFLLAFFYCFMNGEVRTSVMKSFDVTFSFGWNRPSRGRSLYDDRADYSHSKS